MDAFETTGRVEEQHRLVLDQPLPLANSSRVRVIVLCEVDEGEQAGSISNERSTTDSFDAIVDQLGDILDETSTSQRPILSDYAVSREGIYEDHP